MTDRTDEPPDQCNWHASPVDEPRPHSKDREDCWCHPVMYKLCPECDGEGCWRCEDQAPWPGLLVATEWERQDESTPCLIVHAGPEEIPPLDVIQQAIQAMRADLEAGDD